MDFNRNSVTNVTSVDGALHISLPFTPLPMVPSIDVAPQLEFPPTTLPIDQFERQKEVSRPISVYSEKPQPLSIAPHLPMKSNRREAYPRSYYLTGWAFADHILAIADILTKGRAGWLQRLFSFLFVGGLGAVVNLLCYYIIYTLLLGLMVASYRISLHSL
jgi:hypothetical protein